MTEHSKEAIQRAMRNALSNLGFEMQLQEDQKCQIIQLLRQTGRENIEKVVEWMEEHGFFSSAASISNGRAFYGGLATHSFEVYEKAVKLNAAREDPLPEDSVVLCALLHDLCKAGLYYYDKEARCLKEREEVAAQGHGLRSVRILKSCGLPLSYEEEMAIRWHEGEHEEPFDQPEVYAAVKSIPLCDLIRRAELEG